MTSCQPAASLSFANTLCRLCYLPLGELKIDMVALTGRRVALSHNQLAYRVLYRSAPFKKAAGKCGLLQWNFIPSSHADRPLPALISKRRCVSPFQLVLGCTTVAVRWDCVCILQPNSTTNAVIKKLEGSNPAWGVVVDRFLCQFGHWPIDALRLKSTLHASSAH